MNARRMKSGRGRLGAIYGVYTMITIAREEDQAREVECYSGQNTVHRRKRLGGTQGERGGHWPRAS